MVCLLIATCNRDPSLSTAPSSPEETSDTIGAPPPPPSSAFIALLSPDQTAQITAAGFPLILPTDIPGGFRVEQVQVAEGDRFSGYRILYRDGNNQCFLIEYTSGGVGDSPSTENRTPIQSPLLPSDSTFGLNHGQYVDPNLKEQFPEPLLISDWLPIDVGFYRFAGAAYINAVLKPATSCQNVTVDTATTILESSALITEDIQGDGVSTN